MGTEENDIMGFDHQLRSSNDRILDFPSSRMNTNPASAWDPIVSLSQSENFGGSSMNPQSDFGLGNQGMVHYQSDSGLGGMVPRLSCYDNGSFPEIVSSFGLAECGQISNTRCPPNYSVNGGGISKGEQVSEDGGKGKSPCEKEKKRGLESNSPQSHSKGEQRKEMSCDGPEHPDEHDEKRHRTEHTPGTNMRGKQTGKQVKDGSKTEDAAKDDYIHVRARRGQATNSHSLAERIRRERISERMRMLQELVPGCNKITGKAVMLDEIINYVQSLQQQVEFLSMKLATVNPELDINIDRILSKELLDSRGGNMTIPGFGPGINSAHPYPRSMSQGPLPGLSSTATFHQMPQNPWDSEIQSVLQMRFDSYPATNNLEPNGRPKLGL